MMAKYHQLKLLAAMVTSASVVCATGIFIYSQYIQKAYVPESEIGKIAAQYLIKNPENLLKAGEALESQTENTKVDRLIPFAPALLDTSVTPNYGPDDADVAVIEFFDYLCHYCQQVAPVVDQAIREEKGVKYYFKEYPIFAGSKPVSGQSAATGLLIFDTYNGEAYLKYHNNLMAMTGSYGRAQREFKDSDLHDLVVKSGFTSELTKEQRLKYEQVISANMQLGEQMGITGTPGFIVMNKKNPTGATTTLIPGSTDIGRLKAAIQKARGI